MPVFALRLDLTKLKSGASGAVTILKSVSDAADDTQKALKIVGSVANKTEGDLNSLVNQSIKVGDQLVKMGNSAKLMIKAFAFSYAVTKINELRKSLVESASQAEETANKFNVVFASVSDQANRTAENLRSSYGLSREGAQSALSGVADLLTGLGISPDKALKLADQTVRLGTDLASFTNLAGGAERATHALTSALLGETEAAKSLGVVLTEEQMQRYALSVGKVWKDLDLAEKAHLRLNAAMQQSPNAVGDFERSMGSYANQISRANSISQDFSATVGEGLLQAHTSALMAITGNRGAIDQLATAISGFLATESDDFISFMNDLSDNGKKSSEEISDLAIVFVQTAGGAKLLWNSIQLIVDGIIALINTVIVGTEQLGNFGDVLGYTLALDFENAAKSLEKVEKLGNDWYKSTKDLFKTDWDDFNKGLDIIQNPEKFFKQYQDRVNKLRKDAADAPKNKDRPTAPGEEDKSNANIPNDNIGKIDSARRALEGVRAEIEKMRGTDQDFSITLDKKLADIAKNAKIAGLSLQESTTLQAQFSAASTYQYTEKAANAIRDFNIQIANMRGDTATARMLEMEKQAEELAKRFTTLGMVPEQVASNVERFKEAFSLQSQIKDAQEAANFYKELEELSGDYAASQEYTNRLLGLQADNLVRNVGITRSLADEWLRLKQLQESRNGWDGAYRAMKSYYSEATDLGKNFESFTTSTFGNLEDSMVDAFTTGKLSFSDMVNSMVADLARLTLRSSITGPLAKVLGSTVGSLFEPGKAATSAPGLNVSGWGTKPNMGIGFSWQQPASVGGFHAGGVIGYDMPSFFRSVPLSIFDHAPRFHNGRLPYDPTYELPAIIRRDETVLTPGQMQALGSPDVHINVQVINQTGTQATPEVTQTRSSNGDVNLQVTLRRTVANDIASGGIVSQSIQSRFGIQPYVRGR